MAGEASYWIPVIKDSDLDTPEGHQQITAWLTQGEPIPFGRRAFTAQMAILIVFDFLTANPDRYSGGNMKMSEDGRQLFYMDNTMSFFLEPQGTEKNRALLLRQQRFSRRVHEALGTIDVPTLQRAVSRAGRHRDPDGCRDPRRGPAAGIRPALRGRPGQAVRGAQRAVLSLMTQVGAAAGAEQGKDGPFGGEVLDCRPFAS